jgi:hypothetical protein
MSARTIKSPATVSGQGNLASESLTLSNTVNCILTSNPAGDLLVGGVPVGGGGGAVDSVVGSTGIDATTLDGVVTISNTGLLSATGSTGIVATTLDGVVTIANTGLLSATGSTGIDATTLDGVVTIANTGVLAITGGTNVTISGTNDNITINSTGGNSNIVGARYRNTSSPYTFNVPLNTLIQQPFNFTNFNVSATSSIVSNVYLPEQTITEYYVIVYQFTPSYVNNGANCTVNINYSIQSNYPSATLAAISSIELIILNNP